MIPFELDQMRVEHVMLKSCTLALGGSISIIDDEKSTVTQDVLKKIKVPLAVARRFIKEHDANKYIQPVLTAVTYYSDYAIAIERHPQGEAGNEVSEGLLGDDEIWISQSERNLDTKLLPYTLSGDWYTDGLFIFMVRPSDLANYEPLSKDGHFRSIGVDAINLTKINEKDTFAEAESRTCIQFVSANGDSAISPPIWKNLSSIGARQLEHTEDDDEDVIHHDFPFDRIDQFLAVNLSFALKAGNELSAIFGYDVIEPLQFNYLMIRLKTVNLPKVAPSIKSTFDIGLSFTHAVAWLIGLNSRAQTLESYMTLRSLLRHLTTKGVYRKNAFNPVALFKDIEDQEPHLKTMEEALNTASVPSFDSELSGISCSTDTDINSVGPLYIGAGD